MRDALLAFLKGSPPVTWVEIVKAIEPDDETALRDALSLAQADGRVIVSIDPERRRASRYTLASTTTAEIVGATPGLKSAVQAVAEAAKAKPDATPSAAMAAGSGPAQIFHVLSGATRPLTRSELTSLIPNLSISAVKKALQRLSKAGNIVAVGKRAGTRWVVPGAALASPEPIRSAENKPARMRTIEDVASKHARKERCDVGAAAAGEAKVRAALELSYATSCDAVEVYLASIVDPVVYEPLRRSRDEAKAALDGLISGGA